MPLVRKWFVVLAILGGLARSRCLQSAQEKTAVSRARPVTIADTITMTRIGGLDNPSFHPKSGFAVFSPNGKYFALVVTKGDLEHDANDYSLLLFRSADISRHPVPKTLAVFSSSSNHAGISEVKWLDDNDTILFLGSRGTERTQLYSIRCSSGELRKWTSHRTSLVSYGNSEKGDEIVYAAETPNKSLSDEKTLRYGFDVGSERLEELVQGQISSYALELFSKGTGSLPDKRLQTRDPFDSGVNDLYLSPDGRYLVLKTDMMELPENWDSYDDENIRAVLRRKTMGGYPTGILHYELINVRTGRSQVLLDAPATYWASDVLWSPDSKSLLLCGTYLPLDLQDPAELQTRRTSKFVVEIELSNRKITKITNGNLRPIFWDPQTNVVQFSAQSSFEQTGIPRGAIYYRKARGAWEPLAAVPKFSEDARPQVLADEGLNQPPRIVVMNSQASGKTLLMDLNPQFAQLALGKEEEIRWTTKSGTALDAGLVLPPDYTPGKKYPLVIQTHGFDPHRFWIDGPHSSAFAARPLASREIVVLQMNDIFYDTLETTQELDRVKEAYESAIDYLDKKGIIDRDRVGLIGFSRTCMYVKYALTHSTDRFAAALVTDGVDAGYFQYLLAYTADPSLAAGFDNIIGGPPFGDDMELWLKKSPGFSLDKVQTPLLIQAIGPGSILAEWQWFEGLKRLGKPVDLVYLPGGTHVLVRPWDRMVSQGGAVDWFCFWLKGEERPDPAKAEQYVRWRRLRAQSNLSSR